MVSDDYKFRVYWGENLKLFGLFLYLLIIGVIGGKIASASTVDIYAEADSWVSCGTLDTNYGGDIRFYVITNLGTQCGRAVYKYNLQSSIPAGSTINSAKWYVYGGEASGSPNGDYPAAYIALISDQTWTEYGITFNNKPAQSSEIGSLNVHRGRDSTWQSNSVTSYIQTQFNSGNKAGFYILPHTGYNINSVWYSRESAYPSYVTVDYTGESINPTTTIELSGVLGNNVYFTSNVQATLTAIDNEGGSGVAKTEYSLDNGINWIQYTNPFTISNEGTTTIFYRSTDNVGNVEPIITQDIIIDSPPPPVTELSTITLIGIGLVGIFITHRRFK